MVMLTITSAGSVNSEHLYATRSVGLCHQSWSSSYCYSELGVSFPAVVVVIANTHYAYPRRDG